MKTNSSKLHFLHLGLFLASALLVACANYLVFFYVPTERIMGAIQRIFYFHVGSAFASYAAFASVFFASVAYLSTKAHRYDALNRAAAETGFWFATIVLVTGMIWGKAAWGTWFNFEPRLVSFLLLWLVFLGFYLLRSANSEQSSDSLARQSAVLGIIGSLLVPVMVYSIKVLPAFKQLHPQVVEKAGMAPEMLITMLFTGFALVVLQAVFLLQRFRIYRLEYLLLKDG